MTRKTAVEKWVYETQLTRRERDAALDRLAAIREAAEAELARIERHGGTAGFALRVRALCTKEIDPHD